MREILFRGKTPLSMWGSGGGHWVEGSLKLNYQNSICHIIDEDLCESDVLPETVGQFTGFFDSDIKKIFEGDIIQIESKVGVKAVFMIKWDTSFARFGAYNPHADSEEIRRRYGPRNAYVGFDEIQNLDRRLWGGIKIIGNIYDNPELLKPEE